MNNHQKSDNILTDEYLKLDNQICFALYVCSKEIIKKYRPFLEPLGLTYTGYITLLALWEKDKISVKELGEKLYLDSGTMTPLLKKLEKDGLLTRHRSEKDERSVMVELTQKGRELKQKAAEIPVKMMCSAGFDMGNAGDLLSLLKQTAADLTKEE